MGGEDLELAFRLFRRGVRFAVSRAGWAVEAPHPRAVAPDLRSNSANILMFLHKHPDPVVELLWAWFAREQTGFEIHHEWHVEDEYRLVLDAAAHARPVDVTGELDRLRPLAGRARIAVLGCGGDVPDWLAGAALFDFDRDLIDRAGPRACHAVGIRTPLADGAVDLVFITSRLRGLWPRWRDEILAEARRIGADIRGPLLG